MDKPGVLYGEWQRMVQVAIDETERFNSNFRSNHICRCSDKVSYEDGTWVCGKMKIAQRKNAALKEKWMEAFRLSPNFPGASREVMDKVQSLSIGEIGDNPFLW